MTSYTAPTRDMQFVINELAGLEQVRQLPGFEEATPDLVEAVLEEAARLATEVLAPINKSGDLEGSRVGNDGVVVAEGFKEAYEKFVEGGWPGLKFSPEFGGQGLPALLSTAVDEMWQAANMSFALCPLLTQGAIDAIEIHGSDAQQALYLEKMVSGQWTGTMNLTEPQAGSDLAAVRTRAEPEGDHHLITGQKIYITWGDHNVAENIVHLVLARTPDAPEGVKGISLFIVPKFLPDAEGGPGTRNDVHPVSVEHKMGIHASPTCVMSYGDQGGAVGYLVGEENKGLIYMFTMMNRARLSVGLQGLAISERAYQQAREYARQRVQGSAVGHEGRVTIIHHPDVRRMLMVMKAHIEAMRALAYVTMAELDMAEKSTDEAARERHQARVDLLTPVVKGWLTEVGQELTSLGVQIHGGMGFIEETGAAQYFRDARITTIYEGTTGIQALDLVGRKTLRDTGRAQAELLAEMRADVEALTEAGPELDEVHAALVQGLDAHEQAVKYLLGQFQADPDLPGSVAFNMLMLMGTVAGGWQMGRTALRARQALDQGEDSDGFYQTKLATARFYARHIMPRAQAYLGAALAGSEDVMSLSEADF